MVGSMMICSLLVSNLLISSCISLLHVLSHQLKEIQVYEIGYRSRTKSIQVSGNSFLAFHNFFEKYSRFVLLVFLEKISRESLLSFLSETHSSSQIGQSSLPIIQSSQENTLITISSNVYFLSIMAVNTSRRIW